MKNFRVPTHLSSFFINEVTKMKSKKHPSKTSMETGNSNKPTTKSEANGKPAEQLDLINSYTFFFPTLTMFKDNGGGKKGR